MDVFFIVENFTISFTFFFLVWIIILADFKERCFLVAPSIAELILACNKQTRSHLYITKQTPAKSYDTDLPFAQCFIQVPTPRFALLSCTHSLYLSFNKTTDQSRTAGSRPDGVAVGRRVQFTRSARANAFLGFIFRSSVVPCCVPIIILAAP